jgi:hypothetical protein
VYEWLDAPQAEAEPVKSLHGTETILVVEDENTLRSLVTRILERKGYTVLSAPMGRRRWRCWPVTRARSRCC